MDLKGDATEERIVYHYMFTKWADHDVPSNPQILLDFLSEIHYRQNANANSGPILVHCRFLNIVFNML